MVTVMSGPGGQVVPSWPAISPPLQTVSFSLVIPSSAVFTTFETSQSNRLEILFIKWLHSAVLGRGSHFPALVTSHTLLHTKYHNPQQKYNETPDIPLTFAQTSNVGSTYHKKFDCFSMGSFINISTLQNGKLQSDMDSERLPRGEKVVLQWRAGGGERPHHLHQGHPVPVPGPWWWGAGTWQQGRQGGPGPGEGGH